MKHLEKIFKALANRRRLAMVFYLKRVGQANVSSISLELKLSMRATSRHLVQLERAGILEKNQKSKEVFYACPYALVLIIENAIAGS